MTADRTILIAGGGASGALVATNLLRNSQRTRVVVIEPRADLGFGMAYSTVCPLHLLNVTAEKMSAFPDDPKHFLRWLDSRFPDQFGSTSFVPRMIYGRYLNAVLGDARNATAFERFRHAQSKAVRLECNGDRVRVQLANGELLNGDAFVLALGNQAPAPWPNLSPAVAGSGRFFGLTWEPEALNPSDKNSRILLLGTGLTAVDAVLALRQNGHRGIISMISRRGLLPAGHRLSDYAALPCHDSSLARGLSRNVRLAARDAEVLHGNWRVAVDAVRPRTNELWSILSLREQKRFLRHLRPYWDVHRHRMAPEIASSVAQLLADGTLRVSAGRVGSMELTTSGISVSIRSRGSDAIHKLEVARVINCTGPESDLNRVSDPLIRSMQDLGYLVPHPLRTGAMVNGNGALLGCGGEPSPLLFAMGPLRTGKLIETVAMPEIRDQASALSTLLTRPVIQEELLELVSSR